MLITIENVQEKVPISDQNIKLIEQVILKSLEYEEFEVASEVSVMIVDDEEIRSINKEQRNIDKPTDVLSFPMVDIVEGVIQSDEGDFDLNEEVLILGDIVISAETTKRQAEDYGHSFEREIAFLTSHGVFHLLGYDHMTEEEEKQMIGKQEEVLAKMKLTR